MGVSHGISKKGKHDPPSDYALIGRWAGERETITYAELVRNTK
jgi:hypothetical protein